MRLHEGNVKLFVKIKSHEKKSFFCKDIEMNKHVYICPFHVIITKYPRLSTSLKKKKKKKAFIGLRIFQWLQGLTAWQRCSGKGPSSCVTT